MLRRIDASQLVQTDARRICLVKPSALGDVVQTLPLLPVLRRRFPEATVSWLVNAELADVVDGHPDLDEVLRFPRRGPWRDWLRTLAVLRERKFDLVFDLQGLLRTAVMTAATGAPLRVGLESAREGAHLACNCVVPETGRLVAAHQRYWRVAEALGAADVRREPHVPVRREEHAWAEAEWGAWRGPVLAVSPGSQWATKRWPVEKFAVVAAKAVRAWDCPVVLFGSRDERPLCVQLELLLRRFAPAADVRNLAGETTLRQLAAGLARSTVLLTNDSGPMHLAAAMGAPVVGLFTCTSPERSGPPGERHELVAAQVACAASYRKRCPYRGRGHMACLEELATDRVWQALVRIMERRPARAA